MTVIASVANLNAESHVCHQLLFIAVAGFMVAAGTVLFNEGLVNLFAL